MHADQTATAEYCLNAAYDGRVSFPEIVGKLIDAGFEGYDVDYRRAMQIYYLPDGDSVELAMPSCSEDVSARFDDARIAALVRWAQSDVPHYSYAAFSAQAKTAGCAGYHVSFLGRRVVYYGRTAQTHVELFDS
ncbi:DUF1398 domain-containing protein [Sphingopyxis sp. P1IMeth2]|uniref:DUF1398 domain-containing protein n=1 Tax=Sphingopyxis sp. P1IMeth2 TaxID=1892848 RepID=UPI001648BBAF|nr:DUF1398 domain-containing protein [Sphingopyxis sp. P1IMeth2]